MGAGKRNDLNASPFFTRYGEQVAEAWRSIELPAVDRAAAILRDAYAEGRRVFTCGNGGSASIANHFECDHVKGIRSDTDLAPRVTSLASNVELMTAIANDIGYENIFEHQLKSQAGQGDVLVAVSSSGCSQNVLKAVVWARVHLLRTIALTGFEGGGVRMTAETSIHVDCDNYGVIEDVHQGVMHALAQCIRQAEWS